MNVTLALSDPDAIGGLTIVSTPHCPSCGKNALVELVSAMRRYGGADDWFRCDKCDRLFTRPRTAQPS